MNAYCQCQNTALIRATFDEDNYQCAEVLIQAGADVNISNADGATSLNFSANYGREKYVEVLIKAGADVNTRDAEGITSLMDAAFSGNENCVDLLIKAGADVNANINGKYCLYGGSQEGQCEMRGCSTENRSGCEYGR